MMTHTISNLIKGMTQFSKKRCLPGSSYNQMVEQGQFPQVMVIGCCDSLVDPLLLMGAQEGELFVHRNIAALVPPYQHGDRDSYHGTSAALEHGVKNLNVSHIIVLGHACCGGISALLGESSETSESFIQSWIQIASPAKEQVMREYPDASRSEKRHLCEKESVVISLKNLLTFPWIEERVRAGKIHLHGWHFDRGMLSRYNERTKTFDLIDLREES